MKAMAMTTVQACRTFLGLSGALVSGSLLAVVPAQKVWHGIRLGGKMSLVKTSTRKARMSIVIEREAQIHS